MSRRILVIGALLMLACSSETDTGGATSSGAPSATSSSSGGGGAQPCALIADCPAPNACGTYACVAGVCVGTFEEMGAVVPGMAVAGDCKQVICDGQGTVTPVEDDTDLPNDGNPCTDDLCQNGTPSNQPANDGQPCGSGTMTLCQAGLCVGCKDASQCPQGNVCQMATCDKPSGPQTEGLCHLSVDVGAEVSDADPTDCLHAVCDELGAIVPAPIMDGSSCGSSTFCAPWACTVGVCAQEDYVAAGTPTPTGQTSGDCSITVCDGSGNEKVKADTSDTPPNPGFCAYYECNGTTPVLKYKPSGTICPDGTTHCDGSGNCVF